MKTMSKVMLGVVLGVSVFMVLYWAGDIQRMLEKKLDADVRLSLTSIMEDNLNEICDHDGWEIVETKDGEFKICHTGEFDDCQFVRMDVIEVLENTLN